MPASHHTAEGARPRRRADAERSIARILDAAVDALGNDQEASMAEIARRAGVVRATIYVHFPTRDALLDAVTERALAETAAVIDEAEPERGDPADALARVVAPRGARSGATTRSSPSTPARRHQTSSATDTAQCSAALLPLVRTRTSQGAFRADVPAGWHLAMLMALVHAGARNSAPGECRPTKPRRRWWPPSWARVASPGPHGPTRRSRVRAPAAPSRGGGGCTATPAGRRVAEWAPARPRTTYLAGLPFAGRPRELCMADRLRRALKPARRRDDHFDQRVPARDGRPAGTSAAATVELADGDRFALRIAPVSKRIGDATVRMLAYNGSIPGPTLRVPQGSELLVDVENQGDLEATVHWHGLRLENRFDGTHETQEPFRSAGASPRASRSPIRASTGTTRTSARTTARRWASTATSSSSPPTPTTGPPVHRELALTLDDVLIEDGQIAAFSPDETTYAAMGRFGNVLLVAGEPELALTAQHGEVVRLYLTNTANTRVFKVALPGARMKLVGGDSGRCEREQFVEEVILAPSERVVVDVLFETPGQLTLEHRTPDRTYTLADVTVTRGARRRRRWPSAFASPAHRPRADAPSASGSRPYSTRRRTRRSRSWPRWTWASPTSAPAARSSTPARCTPRSSSDEPGRCPSCGMKLIAEAAPTGFACPMHPDVTSETADHCPQCGMKLIPARLVRAQPAAATRATPSTSTSPTGTATRTRAASSGKTTWSRSTSSRRPENMRWKLVDRSDDAENHAIDWQFRVGDRVKIRLVNEMDSDHPMHHPFHIHGAGRFLILARDGVVEPNLVWSDTVLVRTGETVDILLEVTNVGRWMAHCHIAEHHESGMMFCFDVTA